MLGLEKTITYPASLAVEQYFLTMCISRLIDATNYAQQGNVIYASGITLMLDGSMVPHSIRIACLL